MKKWIIIFGVFVILFVGWRIVSNISFINIDVSNSQSDTELVYSVIDNKTNKTTEVKTTSATFKRRVSKGSYQVLVQQGQTSYFEAISTKGFGGTTKITANLVSEKGRQFVGNNPASCFNYVDGVLVSSACTDLFSNVNIHVPATASTPTYAKKVANQVYGYSEGFIDVSGHTLVLIQTPNDTDVSPKHTIYSFDDLTLKSGVDLTDLDPAKSYSIQAYKNGFLVYDNGFEHVLYYPSETSKPTSITLDGPASGKSLQPVSFRVSNGSIVVLYSTVDQKSKKSVSEIVINDGSSSKHYSFSESFTSATACGTNKLCTVGSSGLSVYDITGKKAVFLYKVSGVSYIQNMDNGLLAANDQGILRLDVDERRGFLEYSFGEYRFNALSLDPSGYVLSLTDGEGKKVALRIDQKNNDTDSIDKKVLELEKIPDVKNVSIYGKYIFVSPDLGEYKYNSDLHEYSYDPAVKAKVNNEIQGVVVQMGLDKQGYVVINTLQ